MRRAGKRCGIEVSPVSVIVAIKIVRPIYSSQVTEQARHNMAFFGVSHLGQQVVRPAWLQAEVKPVGHAVA